MARKGKKRSNSKTVVVRYPESERTFTVVFFAVFLAAAVALGIYSGMFIIFLLSAALSAIPMGLVMAHYLSRKIIISSSEISSHSCLHRPKVYRYSDMVKAVETDYRSEKGTVLLMQFQNGKWLTIRGRDENYTRAVNKILKQRKILFRDGADEGIIPKGSELYIEGSGNGSLLDMDYLKHGVNVCDAETDEILTEQNASELRYQDAFDVM